MKTYLGDGVYADIDSGMIKLTTEDGISVANTIYLESDVVANLITYINQLKAIKP